MYMLFMLTVSTAGCKKGIWNLLKIWCHVVGYV